ncbi:MAG: hypothetical protein E5X65_35105 [Mesorhizobium sp.]|nr:MAG: hypothetical protein E5X65_35105 [Mesorhizobium sp.]
MKRYGFVGSRSRQDQNSVFAKVAELPPGSAVVSGGAKGPDKWAEEAARHRGLQTIIHLPEAGHSTTRWAATEKFYARNQKIVDDSDVLIAFVSPDRKGGTEDTIRRARKKGIPVILA